MNLSWSIYQRKCKNVTIRFLVTKFSTTFWSFCIWGVSGKCYQLKGTQLDDQKSITVKYSRFFKFCWRAIRCWKYLNVLFWYWTEKTFWIHQLRTLMEKEQWQIKVEIAWVSGVTNTCCQKNLWPLWIAIVMCYLQWSWLLAIDMRGHCLAKPLVFWGIFLRGWGNPCMKR